MRLSLIGQRRTRKRLDALTAGIANRCETGVWQRVEKRILAMHPVEARGYVRARSAAIMGPHVEAALAASASTVLHAQLLESATQEVIERVMQLRARRIRENRGRLPATARAA